MSKAEEILEGNPQYKTKVKNLKEKMGSRNIRNLVENACKSVDKMVECDNGHPSPRDEASMESLRMANNKLAEAVGFLRKVRDKKK